MFLFKLFATFYTSANALILGFFLPPSSVSAFGGAEKITKTFIGLFTPIFQALFPFINRMARKDIGKTRILINFVLLVVSSVTVLISIFVYINAERIIYLFLGIEFKDSVTLLRLMILLCPIISISSVLGIQWMLPLRLDKKFNDIIIPSAVFSLIMSFVMVPKYGNIAMVLILIFTELTISIRMLSFYYNVNNIN